MEQRRLLLMRWFLLLLLLNILDILITNPVLEINPFTLFLWGKLGILLSAIVKIGLVLLYGVLCIISKKVAKPAEWHFTEKILKTISMSLVSFYLFVVIWNIIQNISLKLLQV